MKAISMIQRVLAQFNLHSYLGKLVDFDFQDVTILALYWFIMVFVLHHLGYIFGRLMLGTYRPEQLREENYAYRRSRGSKEEGAPSRPPTTQWRPSWVNVKTSPLVFTWAVGGNAILHSFL
jgi:hypothetical protein